MAQVLSTLAEPRNLQQLIIPVLCHHAPAVLGAMQELASTETAKLGWFKTLISCRELFARTWVPAIATPAGTTSPASIASMSNVKLPLQVSCSATARSLLAGQLSPFAATHVMDPVLVLPCSPRVASRSTCSITFPSFVTLKK